MTTMTSNVQQGDSSSLMHCDKEIIDTLKHGTKEEKGNVLVTLARQKDPSYADALREIMYADDPFLAVMAAYALGEAGDKAGLEFLKTVQQTAANTDTVFSEAECLDVLEEALRLPDVMSNTFDVYNRSRHVESKEKLLKVLDYYTNNSPRFNIPHFDKMLAFSITKTRGMILDALAICEFNLGNIDKALEYSMEAVTIAEEVGDPQLLKNAYGDLGHIHISLGNYYSALELLHKSLEIDEASHDPWRKRNRMLSNLAQLYYVIGQNDKSLEYIQQALEFAEKENDLIGKARGLNAKAVALANLAENEEAEACFQDALGLVKNELHDKTLEGLILGNLSALYYFSGQIDKARPLLKHALAMSVQTSDRSAEGSFNASMAMLELGSGNVDEAVQHAEAALTISREIDDPSGQIDANLILGTIEDQCNDNPYAAYDRYKEALSLSETLRKNLMLDDFKISFAGNHIGIYQQMIALCVRMGRADDAFEYIERSKSRALVDMLSSTTNTIDSRILPHKRLEEVGALKGKLDLLRKQLSMAYSGREEQAAERAQAGVQEELRDEIAALERTYKKTFDELRMKDPEWTSLVSVGVSDVTSVQGILDAETMLLEFYQLGDETIIIAVMKDKPPSIIRVPIDLEADSERLINLFSALSEGRGINTRSHEFIKEIKQPLSWFHDALFTPLYDQLTELKKDIKHLIIIPYSFWHYLPFHALYDAELKKYLIDKFSISYAPSATTLALCSQKREKEEGFTARKHGQYNSALIIANPTNDLPYAEEEADKVKMRFDKASVFKQEQASLDRLLDNQAADVIHLACHGYFRGDDPLFSHLVFSDTEGKETPVFMPDIFNLKLNASLVTLSACETGLSQLTTGDELIGISRAFFYAGASSLLASLWTVNDKSTALLMDRFYEGLVRMGEDKANALRSAILELKAMPEYGHPYFWAPFFLSGEWR